MYKSRNRDHPIAAICGVQNVLWNLWQIYLRQMWLLNRPYASRFDGVHDLADNLAQPRALDAVCGRLPDDGHQMTCPVFGVPFPSISINLNASIEYSANVRVSLRLSEALIQYVLGQER
jgi:hypothetical protein